MKILAPIKGVNEIPLLNEAGADEFFCGYIPNVWLQKYNKSLYKNGSINQMQISMNRRDGLKQNITDLTILKKVVNEAKLCDSKIFITLNNVFYPEEAYVQMKEVCDELASLNIDGLIVTDVGLIQYLKDEYPNLNIVLSTCQPIYNSYATKYFRNIGVKRITFPRHMTLREVIKITNEVPDIEYECFILDGKCIYDDGNCKALHNAGVFCWDQWEYSYFHAKDSDFDYHEMQNIYDTEERFKRWSKPYPSEKTKINGWPFVGCGICAIPSLIKNANMTALKLSGRGASLDKRVALVRFVKEAVQMAEQGGTVRDIKDFGKKVLGIPEMCDLGNRCYMHVMDKVGE